MLVDIPVCLMPNDAYENWKRERDELIVSNQKLVTWIVYRYFKSHVHCDADLEDLNAVGMRGLIYASNKYDPTRGVKFSTYATHAIRNVLINYVNRETKMKLPTVAGVEGMNIVDTNYKHTLEVRENVECLREKLEILRKELLPVEDKILTLFLNGKSRHDISTAVRLRYTTTCYHLGKIIKLAKELVA